MGLFSKRGDTGERGPKGHVGAHRAGGTAKGTYVTREDRDASGRLLGFAVLPEGKETAPDNYNPGPGR